MKLCRTAGLALAGWYLLYPPWSANKNAIDPKLPLARWYEVGTFDSLSDCETQKAKVLEDLDRHTHNPDMNKVVAQLKLRPQARCVAADDPQLKDR
jgi:hypothetical protein